MSTTVRLFASLREAAGQSSVESEAATVAELLEELRERYGADFARPLEVATVMVDGDVEQDDSPRTLEDVDEVALLPPFSGG